MSADRAGRVHPGRLTLGAILLIVGVGWLLQVLEVVEVRWQALLAAALIAIGLALMVVGRQGGLITLGAILTVLLAFASMLDVPFEGGVGERAHRPTAAADLEERYRLGIGTLTVDLTDVEIADGTAIEASVGMGELVVVVPGEARVRASGRAGVGEVLLLGRSQGGLGVEHAVTEGSGPDLEIEASVGMGKVEVRR